MAAFVARCLYWFLALTLVATLLSLELQLPPQRLLVLGVRLLVHLRLTLTLRIVGGGALLRARGELSDGGRPVGPSGRQQAQSHQQS